MTNSQPTSMLDLRSQNSSSIKELSPPSPTRIRLNSIGSRLFLAVLAGALIGLGGFSYLTYKQLERRAEQDLENKTSVLVGQFDAQLTQAQDYSQDLSLSAKLLYNAGIRDAKVYEQMAFSFFQRRPKLVMSANVGQAPNRLVPERKGFYPYFYVDPGKADAPGKLLSAPNNNVRYTEIFSEVENYFEKEYYTLPFKQDKPMWFEPYDWYGISMTTYAIPLKDDRGKPLGVFGADVNVATLAEQVPKSAIENAGFYALLSDKGNVLAYPPDPQKAQTRESYQKIAALNAVWSQVQQGQKGLIRVGNNFVAYQRIPTTNWLVLTVVPQSVILKPVLLRTAGGAALVAVILAGIVILYIRWLRGRLQPILAKCNELAAADAQILARLEKEDEIGQLDVSFNNLIAQLNIKEEQIRNEVARSVQKQEKIERVEREKAESEILQKDVGQLLDLVLALEEGDLTVEAPVSDRVTGLVSDSFNRLVEQLARIMAVVSSTAQQVNQSAENLQQLAGQTAQQVEQQTQSVESVQVLMHNINDLTQDNTQQALNTNESVQQAQDALVRGQEQMKQLTTGIDTLGQGTEQIIKRMQTLTDFVQLAVQFAKEQKRIASMTRVLSLNASLLSTRATEQQDPEQFASIAREFETVATQVNNLAVQTSQSLFLLQQRTDQIQTVVSGLNQDVVDINQIVKNFTAGVGQSRQIFDEINTATVQVAKVGQQVTQSSVAIAEATQTTLKSIQEIAALASDTKRQTNITQEQSVAMGQIARDLYEMVRFFRIAPEQMQAASKIVQSAETNGSSHKRH